MLGPGDFFGEGCLAGQSVRVRSATAISASAILFVDKDYMRRLLHKEHALSDLFIVDMLARHIRSEDDLTDQLVNSTEQRLARTRLLLSRNGKSEMPIGAIPRISQKTLSEMVGTTRSRVNVFMKKFQRLGFIDCTDSITVRSSLVSVVTRDDESYHGLRRAVPALIAIRWLIRPTHCWPAAWRCVRGAWPP